MNLDKFKPLSTEQYDRARETAIERVKARIGKEPARSDFQRDLGALWNVLDVLALVVFVAALVISSMHITSYVGEAVKQAEAENIGANQIAYIFLAESSMILFMTLHGLTVSQRKSRPWYLRPFSIHLLLASTAAVFIFTANLSSGVGFLLSLMPPLFTVGIAFNLERLIIQGLQRNREVNRRYLAAKRDYEAATQDPEQHSKFYEYFAQAIWDKLIGLKANRDFADAPAPFRVAVVRREMERDRWMFAEPNAHMELPAPENQDDEKRLPFGSTAPIPDAPEYIRTSEPAGVLHNSLNGNGSGKLSSK